MNKLITKFAKSEEGVTALEYGLIAGVVALAVLVSATNLGTDLGLLFTAIANKVTGITAGI
ncbi:Flp family type IVb pilin [Paraburkholderia sp. A2WS-5]|uniref:Flp family type IVb pilin n=1 Tax=unclassified Paraburkholderia TaxID=2615204 RepID=UPI003B7A70A4